MTVCELMRMPNREYVDWQALTMIENAEREAGTRDR